MTDKIDLPRTPHVPAEPHKLLKTDQELLDHVPLHMRTPLVMAHGGNSYVWIAEQLQIPVGTVRSRIHRARKCLTRLRAKIGAQSVENAA